MNEVKSLLEKNYDKKRKWKPIYVTEDEKGLAVVCSSREITSIEIRQILTDVWHIVSTKSILKNYDKIYFNVPTFNPNDKLVYIILESLIYELISKYDYEVFLGTNGFISNINTQGFPNTALGKMAQGLIGLDEFKKKHLFSINEQHFRKIIKSGADEFETSNLLSEIKTFLYRFNMPQEFKSKCAKIITELVDNALEHGQADCLVDIDVTEPNYHYKDEKENHLENNYFGLNVVVLNFSNKNLGDEVKEKIQNHYYNNSERYDYVGAAYANHRKSFDKKKYTEEDFFNVTAFQEKISGRKGETKSGGTGLAELIRNLQEYAYDDYCYLMTGDKGLFFKKEFLQFNDEKWVGFNEQSDYITDIPNIDSLMRSATYLPGTGYNFLFVFKEK